MLRAVLTSPEVRHALTRQTASLGAEAALGATAAGRAARREAQSDGSPLAADDRRRRPQRRTAASSHARSRSSSTSCSWRSTFAVGAALVNAVGDMLGGHLRPQWLVEHAGRERLRPRLRRLLRRLLVDGGSDARDAAARPARRLVRARAARRRTLARCGWSGSRCRSSRASPASFPRSSTAGGARSTTSSRARSSSTTSVRRPTETVTGGRRDVRRPPRRGEPPRRPNSGRRAPRIHLGRDAAASPDPVASIVRLAPTPDATATASSRVWTPSALEQVANVVAHRLRAEVQLPCDLLRRRTAL